MTSPLTSDDSTSIVTQRNRLLDANHIYDAASATVRSCSFKYRSQLFERDKLLNVARIQKSLKDGTYRPQRGKTFVIKERGKKRLIISDSMIDKTINHLLCDDVLTPCVNKYLQFDNTASQKNKGVDLHRRRLKRHLAEYFHKYQTNQGWILLMDFSGYYANIRHDVCLSVLADILKSSTGDIEMRRMAYRMTRDIFETFKVDVSDLTDEEFDNLWNGKLEPLKRYGNTGKRYMRKGVNIGNQVSQNIGIMFPRRIDNLIKIVLGLKLWGRYTDDSYIISNDKEQLENALKLIKKECNEHGIILNTKKTYIQPLNKPFRHLQMKYFISESGKISVVINPKSLTRERKKLKAYKRMLNSGKLTLPEVENAFKSWFGSFWKYMSRIQIINLISLYEDLFGPLPKDMYISSRVKWMLNKKK